MMLCFETMSLFSCKLNGLCILSGTTTDTMVVVKDADNNTEADKKTLTYVIFCTLHSRRLHKVYIVEDVFFAGDKPFQNPTQQNLNFYYIRLFGLRVTMSL